MEILDIGCGNNKILGAFGIDRVQTKCTDMVCDVAKGIPLPDNSYDEIYMNHILEHLPDTLFIMEEVYRVLKPGGIVHIEVPHYTSICAIMDPTHCKLFSTLSMVYFQDGNCFGYYSKAKFNILETKFIIYHKSLKPLQYILNVRPSFFERFLLRFLPVDVNIQWVLKKEIYNVS